MTFPQHLIVSLIYGIAALSMGVSKDALFIVICIAMLEVFKPIFMVERVKFYGKKGLFNGDEIRDHNK